jgi:hypothetical protein
MVGVMKMRKFLLVFLIALSFLQSGCLYTNVKYPLDEDLLNTDLGSKVGKASNHIVLWLFAWGDAGTEAAAKDGNIKIVKHLDAERYVLLFGLYSKVTTVAYGD